MMPAPALLRQLRDGIAAVQAKDFGNARALLQPVAEAFPNDARPWFWLAVASPSADTAIPCLRRVLTIDAGHAQARSALAKLLLTHAASLVTAGRRGEARGLVTEAASLTPDTDRVWVALAIVSDDLATRLDALRRAHAINALPATRAHLVQAMLQQAAASSASSRTDAHALYEEVLALDAADLRAWHGLMQLAATTAEALEIVRTLVRNAPEQEAGRAFLKKALIADARVLEFEGQSDRACSRWREALGLDEYDIDAWLGLAQSTSDEEEAQRAITTAFDINPTDARVSSAMARMQEATFDAAAYEIPQDAFAHLEGGDDLFAVTVTADAPLLDAVADPFARFAPVDTTAPQTEAARVPEQQPATADHDPVAATPSRPEESPRRTVMIVDDSPTIRKILGLTLERAGYKVVAEPDGESALERLTQVVPDVMLLDIAMPNIDGYEVCRRLKADPQTAHVPVVMLSGKDAFFDKVKGRVAGASEYLTKPFETPAVLDAVAAACQPVCR
jgi:twitching motility two-component system response regulator PilG